jgi:phage terminase large subunit GpA-like protein
LKDSVFNASRRQSGGPARLHFPTWLGAAFWDEFRAEVRQPNGKWKQIRKRNESIDLCAMIWAGALHLGADRINWDNPTQPWARPIEHNSERETREERRERQQKPRTTKSARRGVGKSEWSSRL